MTIISAGFAVGGGGLWVFSMPVDPDPLQFAVSSQECLVFLKKNPVSKTAYKSL